VATSRSRPEQLVRSSSLWFASCVPPLASWLLALRFGQPCGRSIRERRATDLLRVAQGPRGALDVSTPPRSSGKADGRIYLRRRERRGDLGTLIFKVRLDQ
jgi:hypothetical protein